MGAIAFITAGLVLALGIGLLGLLAGSGFLVWAVLTKKSKLAITLSIAGIVLSAIPMILSILGISYFRYMITQDEIPVLDTGTTLYWEYDDDDEQEEYFIYNDKKYIFLTGTGYWKHKPHSRETDRPVANIIERENNPLSRLFMFIFGIKDNEALLYTVKGYPDDSLLIEDRVGFMYCAESTYNEKINYYDDIDNYVFYAARGHSVTEEGSVRLYNDAVIKEIYTYPDSANLIQRPPENECDYIYIFGISNDGILIKPVASIIVYNNRLYKEFGFFTEEEAKGMAALDTGQSEYIHKIITDNGW